jgi:hypothetical protein
MICEAYYKVPVTHRDNTFEVLQYCNQTVKQNANSPFWTIYLVNLVWISISCFCSLKLKQMIYTMLINLIDFNVQTNSPSNVLT